MSLRSRPDAAGGAHHGRHRRHGLLGHLRLGRTVRLHARRVTGALALLAGLVAVAVLAALGPARPDSGVIPGYQKPDNPFLHSQPSGRGGEDTARSRPYPSPGPSLGIGGLLPPVQLTPAPPVSPRPTVPPSPTVSPTPPVSPRPTVSPSPSPTGEPTQGPGPEPTAPGPTAPAPSPAPGA